MRTGSLLDRRITVHLPATGAALVVGIIATGSWLLWTQGAHWGQPFGFNPDEYRYLTRIVNDPSVAFWTTYGRWPIYFQRIAAGLTGTSMSDLVLARQLSALVSCAGLIAAALSSRKISGGFGAVLTIASLAGAPSVVQSAHFFITDVWLYVGVTFTILFCLQTLENTGWPTTVALGVSWGIATGSKLSGVFLLPAVFLAYAFSRGYHRRWKLVGACILAASITLLGQPTLLAYGVQAYLRDGALLSTLRVIAGAALPAYTLQFANTPAWTYYFTHLLWYGAGPFLLVAASAGRIIAIAHAFRRRHFWRVDFHF